MSVSAFGRTPLRGQSLHLVQWPSRFTFVSRWCLTHERAGFRSPACAESGGWARETICSGFRAPPIVALDASCLANRRCTVGAVLSLEGTTRAVAGRMIHRAVAFLGIVLLASTGCSVSTEEPDAVAEAATADERVHAAFALDTLQKLLAREPEVLDRVGNDFAWASSDPSIGSWLVFELRGSADDAADIGQAAKQIFVVSTGPELAVALIDLGGGEVVGVLGGGKHTEESARAQLQRDLARETGSALPQSVHIQGAGQVTEAFVPAVVKALRAALAITRPVAERAIVLTQKTVATTIEVEEALLKGTGGTKAAAALAKGGADGSGAVPIRLLARGSLGTPIADPPPLDAAKLEFFRVHIWQGNYIGKAGLASYRAEHRGKTVARLIGGSPLSAAAPADTSGIEAILKQGIQTRRLAVVQCIDQGSREAVYLRNNITGLWRDQNRAIPGHAPDLKADGIISGPDAASIHSLFAWDRLLVLGGNLAGYVQASVKAADEFWFFGSNEKWEVELAFQALRAGKAVYAKTQANYAQLAEFVAEKVRLGELPAHRVDSVMAHLSRFP